MGGEGTVGKEGGGEHGEGEGNMGKTSRRAEHLDAQHSKGTSDLKCKCKYTMANGNPNGINTHGTVHCSSVVQMCTTLAWRCHRFSNVA